MDKLIIKNARDFYSFSDSSSDEIRLLGGFLCMDVGGSVDSWKSWINEPHGQQDMGSNYSHLEKRDGKIIIAFEIDYFNETPGAPVFELTVPQINYILDRWKEALEKRPNKIIITKDDQGAITVEFED